METQDFTTVLLVGATPREVFDAVNDVRGWWSENIEGDTDQPGGEFSYHYQDVHRAKMKIIEFVPDKRVSWKVLDNYFKFTQDVAEWKDTQVIFEIAQKGDRTELRFTHKGLVPEYECYQVCHDAWTHYIQDSLKALILTGKGSPTPRDAGEGNPGAQLSEPVSAGPASKSICHRLLIEAPVEKVYSALITQEGLAGWWTPETTAEPVTGSIARFGFGLDYFKEMKVTELMPYSRVKWLCLQAFEEWIDTTLTFELEPHRKGAVLFFRHEGWAGYTPEFASCSYDWALFFRSLKFLCEKGKGFPYPDFNQ